MSTIITTTASPNRTSRIGRNADEDDLLDRLIAQGAWIWVAEASSIERPGGAENEQRAFRKLYTYHANRKPKSATIMVTGDDKVAVYVNGILIAPPDNRVDWTVLNVYHVPLPIVQADESTSMLLGFRVINGLGEAGLFAGVRVNYDDSVARPEDTFYTGLDQSWLGEKNFQEHWEHPVFDAVAEGWRPAVVFTRQEKNPDRLDKDKAETVFVLEQLPPLPSVCLGAAGGSSDEASNQCQNSADKNTPLIGATASGWVAFVIAAVVAICLWRQKLEGAKRAARNRSDTMDIWAEDENAPETRSLRAVK